MQGKCTSYDLLGSNFKATSVWNGLKERTERALAGWKILYLSKAPLS